MLTNNTDVLIVGAGPTGTTLAIALQQAGVNHLLIDKLTPYKLWEEIVEHRNVALAIVVAATAISIGMIVASAVHG